VFFGEKTDHLHFLWSQVLLSFKQLIDVYLIFKFLWLWRLFPCQKPKCKRYGYYDWERYYRYELPRFIRWGILVKTVLGDICNLYGAGGHHQRNLAIRTLNYYAIDIDIRNLADYLILKSQGVQGLARDLQWLYSYFNPSTVRNMPPQYFIMISKTGALGLGEFPYPEWHKKEKENILSNIGIKVEYGEPAFEGEYKGTFRTVGDKEHAEIVRLYIEEGLGFNKIAEILGRSSRTPLTQIQKHNRAVERSGFCPICRRAKSKNENQIASKD